MDKHITYEDREYWLQKLIVCCLKIGISKRELFEETGLIAHDLELFGVFSGKDLHYIYPNGDEVLSQDYDFTAEV